MSCPTFPLPNHMPETNNTNKAMMDSSELNSSHRIAKAIIGFVVVILLILVGVGIINIVRGRFSSTSVTIPTAKTITTPTTATDLSNGTAQTNTAYNVMPATGPTELVIFSAVALLLLGRGAIVLSKRLL